MGVFALGLGLSVASGAAAGTTRWPGPLRLVQEYPWPATGVIAAVSAAYAAVAQVQSRRTSKRRELRPGVVERTAAWVVGREETARVVEAVLRAGSGRTVGITTAVYPDGSWLTSSDASGAVRVWDKESGQSSLVLDFPDETFFGFALAAVSPDGRFVAVSEMKRVHLWDRETRRAAAVLENDTGRVEALTNQPRRRLAGDNR